MTTKKFSRLTPGQEERLNLLVEECAEVVQAVGKILRHGYESRNPNNPYHAGNRTDLERELGHVVAAMDMLHRQGEINVTNMMASAKDKRVSVHKYLHHQERTCEAK